MEPLLCVNRAIR